MRIRRWFNETSRVRRSAVQLVGGAGVGEVVAFLGALPLAVIYSPASLGVYGAIGAAAGISGLAGGLTLDLAIPSADTRRLAGRLASAALLVSGTLSAFVVTGALGLLSATVVPLAVASGIAAAAVVSWSITAFEVTSAVCVREGSYRRLSVARIVRPLVQVLLQVLLGLLTDLGTVGLVVGLVVGRLVASAMMVSTHRELFSTLTPSRIRSVLRAHREYPLLAMPAQLLTVAGVQAPMLVVPLLFGADVAGNLFLARRVLAGPTGVIARAVSLLYFGEAASAAREGRSGRKLFRVVVWRGSALAVVLIVGCAALGPLVVPAVLGEEWFQAGVLLAILAPAYGGQLVASPLSRAFQIYSAQGKLLVWALGRFAAIIALFTTAWLVPLGFIQTMVGLAVVLAAGHVVQVFQARSALQRADRVVAA